VEKLSPAEGREQRARRSGRKRPKEFLVVLKVASHLPRKEGDDPRGGKEVGDDLNYLDVRKKPAKHGAKYITQRQPRGREKASTELLKNHSAAKEPTRRLKGDEILLKTLERERNYFKKRGRNRPAHPC